MKKFSSIPRPRTLLTPALLAPFLLALGACSVQPDKATQSHPNPSAESHTRFVAEHTQWVKSRADDLSKPDGWTSLIGLHWLDAGRHSIGRSDGNDIRLTIGPESLGHVELRDDTLYFHPSPEATVSVDGQPVHQQIVLQPEGRSEGTQLVYDDGKGKISVVHRADRLALRIRHADAPERLAFHGLDFFPADETWQVEARFVAHPAGKTLPVVNIIGNVNETPNPGYVEFEREGRTWRLEALGNPATSLNLMFQDASSGKQTYAVGRYLHTGAVAADGTVTVDFNRAYNPPCAYTEYATCPLPPPENRFAQKNENGELVRLAVLAGEKTYAAVH